MKKSFVRQVLLILVCGLFFALIVHFDSPFASNNVYSLEKQAVFNKIIDSASAYLVDETRYAKIYYTEYNREIIPTVKNIVDLYYPMILTDFGLSFEETGQLSVVIYPDSVTLENALGIKYRYAPMGVYYGGVINVLSPDKWVKSEDELVIKERFLKEGPMVHEMVHFAVDFIAGGNYPLWFTEGVALYYENKYIAYEWRPDLKEQAAEVVKETLFKDFKSVDEALAYRKSFDIIADFVENYGEERLQEIILGLGSGGTFEFGD